jgi:ribosomal protein S27E
MTPLLVGKDAGAARAVEYVRHQPEQTLLYQLVERYYPAFVEHLATHERALPAHVLREFDDYLKCGRLEQGFLRVRCVDCHAERLVAFSCKRRGFCPSCGARRMAEGAALLVDEVLPHAPLRQWVLSVPFALRYLFATQPAVMSQVLGIVTRAISNHLIKAAGFNQATAQTGAVTLIDGAHPCAPPFGRTACVPIGFPADWSTLWQCAESEHPLPYACSRRRVCADGQAVELSAGIAAKRGGT